MKSQIATDSLQSQRLLACGVSADTADMIETRLGNLLNRTQDFPVDETKETLVWSLSRLLELMPFKIQCGNYEYWLDIAPMDYGKQWSIGYYCTEKPRVIKGLTHTNSLIECAVQEIEFLTANNYKLNEITEK